MLTDTALRNLKPKSKPYKASDRDGMYVTVSTTGTGADGSQEGETPGQGQGARPMIAPMLALLQNVKSVYQEEVLKDAIRYRPKRAR